MVLMVAPFWKRSEIWGLIVALVILVMILALVYRDFSFFLAARERTEHAQAILDLVDDTFSDALDLETGQRGYLLLGDAAYLAPYEAARDVVRGKMGRLVDLTAGDPALNLRVKRFDSLLLQKMAELEHTVEVRRDRGFEAARDIVRNGEGKILMDEIRREIAQIESEGRARVRSDEKAAEAYRLRAAYTGAIGSSLLFILLVGAAILVRNRGEQREQAMASLLDSKREVDRVRDLLETTLKSIGDAVIATDAEGRVTFLNPIARQITEWDAAAHGRPVEDVFRIINEHTRDPVESPIDKVRRTGTVAGLANHTLLLTRTGREVPIDDSGAPIRDSSGALIGFVLVFRDITRRRAAENALRQSELRFRSLVAGTTSMVWETDAMGSFQTEMPQWEKFTGQTFDQYRGWGGLAALHPDDRRLVEKEWRSALERGESFHIEFRLWHETSGRYRNVVSRGVPLRSPSGEVHEWIGTLTDVTEQRQLEDKLRQSAKLESLGVLAGGIAHDFNNLLVGVLGNASILETSLPDPADRAIAAQITQAGERAAALTKQMLAYSGRGRFIVGLVDLGTEVQQILPLVRAAIPKQVEVLVNLQPEMPPVEVDRAQLQQLVMNLVINGVEAIETESGTVTVSLSTRTLKAADIAREFSNEDLQPGTYALLEVSDTGKGMDEATRNRIFEPFFTTKFTGRGLGLAATLGIIKGHHGLITVSSAVGQGSTFRVYLPAATTLRVPVPGEPTPATGHASATVLVADDEQVVRDLARRALEGAGFQVLEATNGKEAIDVLRRDGQQISAVVLDLSMPVMSGEQALHQIREFHPSLRILASSGYSELEAAQRFGNAIDGFIQKPYTSGRLVGALRQALDRAL